MKPSGAPLTDALFQQWLAASLERTETALKQRLPGADVAPARLHEAMRYAVLGGGKRIRALLVYAAGAACGDSTAAVSNALDGAACAVEMIHAYSLVHDDLPCMDNDVLRRGQPTLHIAFDEATAMLAADALQPLAFETLANLPVAPGLVVQAVQSLAGAVGSLGMVGGQAIDLASVGQPLTRAELETMHRLKTGALLRASVTLGAIVAGAASPVRRALDQYAQAVGLAFQVVDDILDVTGSTAALGKTAGKDADADKPTFVTLLGLDGARAQAETLRQQARAALAECGDNARQTELLARIADYIVLREH